MIHPRQDLQAPERLSLQEAAWCASRGFKTVQEIRRRVRALRLRKLAKSWKVCNGRVAAWALVSRPYVIRRLASDGRLAMRKVYETGRRYHFEVLVDDLEDLAEELG